MVVRCAVLAVLAILVACNSSRSPSTPLHGSAGSAAPSPPSGAAGLPTIRVASDAELAARHAQIVQAASTKCISKMQPMRGLLDTLFEAGARRAIVRAVVEAQVGHPDVKDEDRKAVWTVAAIKFAELGELDTARTMIRNADDIRAPEPRGIDIVELGRTYIALGQSPDRARLSLRDVPLLVKAGHLEKAKQLMNPSGSKIHYAAALLAFGRAAELPGLVAAAASDDDKFWLLYGWLLGAAEQHGDVAAAATALAAFRGGSDESRLRAIMFARRHGHASEVARLRRQLRERLGEDAEDITLAVELYHEALVVEDAAEAATIAAWLSPERLQQIAPPVARGYSIVGAIYRGDVGAAIADIRRFDMPSPRELFFVMLWLRHVSTSFDPAVEAQLADACATLYQSR